MENKVRILLPKLGESILSATVVRWFKQVGDVVCEEEPLLEVTTDKVNSEIPSTVAGVLQEILVNAQQEVQVGEVLAVVSSRSISAVETREPEASVLAEHCLEQGPNRGYFSPAVMRLALDQGMSMEELGRLRGSGCGGRVSKQDVEKYLHQQVPSTHETGGVEKVKMSTMRKAIADNMVKSFYGAPHATLVCEVDVTAIVEHIHQIKEQFFIDHGHKLTISTFLAKALAGAVLEHPLMNSSLEEDTIVVKHFVNLGIAVSVDQGIMVPVIKNCHQLTLQEVAGQLSLLALRARNKELKIEETQSGTITMTNFGMSGVSMGVPIIRYPEVAIIGVGAIQKKVVVLEGDVFGIRSMMNISLTFDHRIIDGMYGCGFLKTLKDKLEQPSGAFNCFNKSDTIC